MRSSRRLEPLEGFAAGNPGIDQNARRSFATRAQLPRLPLANHRHGHIHMAQLTPTRCGNGVISILDPDLLAAGPVTAFASTKV